METRSCSSKKTAPVLTRVPQVSALEGSFPAELAVVPPIAESWRKEVHRPATHVHKWWAHRLGTVFRAVLVAAVTETAEAARRAYEDPSALEGVTVYDPCGGSGTTAVETLKLGGRAVLYDINPVAVLVARQAVAPWDVDALKDAFSQVDERVSQDISDLFVDELGRTVLHYFWVAHLPCPSCGEEVDLRSSLIFAKHAYPSIEPMGHATCPYCDGVTQLDVTAGRVRLHCPSCGRRPKIRGPFSGRSVSCLSCGIRRQLTDWIDENGAPPKYRMYAKLVLDRELGRVYEPVDAFDLELYESIRQRISEGLRSGELIVPRGELAPGHSTQQLLRWGFKSWRQLYSDRQVYSLGLVAAAIRDLQVTTAEREAIAALVSGSIDFHTRLTSYKGEGTGAVRHTFTNHALQPQRTPIETHVWGKEGSSGGISSLFKSRLLAAAAYKSNPTDLTIGSDGSAKRVTNISASLNDMAGNASIVLGDGAETYLRDGEADLIVTDPPYIGKVHYSELADLFHEWLTSMRPFDGYPDSPTTRHEHEAQDPDPQRFADSATRIWIECHRVMADKGLLAFTFHHPDPIGWIALYTSLAYAGFTVSSLQPVKGEMSSAVIKRAMAEPSDLDVVVVARKRNHASQEWPVVPRTALAWMRKRLRALMDAGLELCYGDVKVCANAALLAYLSQSEPTERHEELVSQAVDLSNRYASKFARSVLGAN